MSEETCRYCGATVWVAFEPPKGAPITCEDCDPRGEPEQKELGEEYQSDE